MKKIQRRDFLSLWVAVAAVAVAEALFANPKKQESLAIFSIKDGFRYVKTNSNPDHITGQFPNKNDPYGIGDEINQYCIPLNPKIAQTSTNLYDRHCRFGIAINGVPFDPAGPMWSDGWYFEVLSQHASKYLGIDMNNAHVQPYDRPFGTYGKNGEYHYHGLPFYLFEQVSKNNDRSIYLIGYAADGFGIYAPFITEQNGKKRELKSSYMLKKGIRRPIKNERVVPSGEYDGTFTADYEFVKGAGDLDEFNGRFAPTPEHPDGVYHYIVTTSFPFVPRILRGEVADERFFHKKAPGAEQTPKELASYPAKKW